MPRTPVRVPPPAAPPPQPERLALNAIQAQHILSAPQDYSAEEVKHALALALAHLQAAAQRELQLLLSLQPRGATPDTIAVHSNDVDRLVNVLAPPEEPPPQEQPPPQDSETHIDDMENSPPPP